MTVPLQTTKKVKVEIKPHHAEKLGRAVDKALKLLEEFVEVLGEISLLAEEFTRIFDGYSYEVTWVKNKAGDRYYYAYLKSKTRRPSSIYLGKPSERLEYRRDLKAWLIELEKASLSLNTLKTILLEIQTTTRGLLNFEKEG